MQVRAFERHIPLTGKEILFNKSLLLKEWLVWESLTNVLEVKNSL